LAQFALLSGRIAIEFVRNWILTHVSLSINISILSKFLSKLMKLPISFFDSKRTGDILQRMNDHSRIESFLTGSSLNTLFSLINLFIFSIVLIFFNTRIFFIFFIASFLYSLWVVFFLKKRKELDHKRFGLASQEQSKAIQFIQGMQEIKLHGMEKKIKKTWENLQQGLYKIGIKGLVLTQKQQAGSFIINESKNLIITFLSAKAVIEGQMTLGSMIAIQYIVGQLNSPIEQMTGFLQSLQNATISMDRLNEIHNLQDEEPEHIQFKQIPPGLTSKLAGGLASVDIEEPFLNVNKEFQFTTDSISLKKIEPGIHLQNLSFSYKGAGNEPVLKDVNLFIPKGKTTAIVGVSGSGKTTLLKLLLKFYEPTNGNIKLNEISLNEISAGQWRKSCGAVMQDSFIFSDSIANNIALGAEELDIAKLNSALEISNLSEFIEGLPLGINTKIGAEGTGISMGQKQRVLIARVVYKNPDFVFFDEATNSLDANNESSIIKKIESFLKHKTFVVVAHRLSTVKNADQIIVLDKGRIVEKGKHVQLINQQGFYYTLVRNQLEIGE
jgi:ATP-binding cassette subfamily B protein